MTDASGLEAVELGGALRAALPESPPRVLQFRQIVLWPIQLMPHARGVQIQRHWELLEEASAGRWAEVADEFTDDPGDFSERHYKEFVTFQPYVQRILYGEGPDDGSNSPRPMRVFRRNDVAQARIRFPGDDTPTLFDVAHVDLHFFYDIDVAILALELVGHDISLACALNSMYRVGRAYPTHWEPSGRGGHCAERVEWLSVTGEVLSTSDYEDRARYLTHVGRHRAPHIASHWAYLLRPLVPDRSGEPGNLRYREIEYQRMPVMSYLALDDKSRLARSDFVRLGLVTRPGEPGMLPYSEEFLRDFETRYCYDRYWEHTRCLHDWPDTRFLCSGHAFTVIVDANDEFCVDQQSGVLSQFRHQHFLLGLIAHFQKAALLMLRDRLVVAMTQLDLQDVESVRSFKRSIRHIKEIFLRFTHRYWFHEISDQALARDLYRLWAGQLGTDVLYNDVRNEILDMTEYLDSDQVRRQAETVVRLTVVTVLGLIFNIVTGWFGMNLLAAADEPLLVKTVYFLLVLTPAMALILYTVYKSKRLAYFLEIVADDKIPARGKLKAYLAVGSRKRRADRTSGADRPRRV
jgi:hypothetical protein